MAVDAGLIREAKTADGYNIAPFLRFLDAFSSLLDQALEKSQNVSKVFHEESESGTSCGADEI